MLTTSKNPVTYQQDTELELSKLIQKALVDNLFTQYLPAILLELVIVAFVSKAFWSISTHLVLVSWMAYAVLISVFYRAVVLILRHYYLNRFSCTTWKNLFILGALLSGSTWGAAGYFLIGSTQSMVYQSFLIILILGVTCAANGINSAFRAAYGVFLFSAMAPFILWLFMQGGLHVYLGVCAIMFCIAMLVTSFSTHKLLYDSLELRFKNTDLDSMNHLLEQEVNQRTDDLKHSLALIASTLESTEDSLIVMNLEGLVHYYNQQVLQIWNIPPSAIKTIFTTDNIKILLNQLTNPAQFLDNHCLPFDIERENHSEIEFKDGRVLECYSKPHRLDNKIIGRILGFRDITKRKQLEQHISYQATHDTLTGLPNRALLYDRIEHSINYSKRYHNQLVVMFVDIDNFKEVNDSIGHHNGDLLIQTLASRLQETIRKSDTAARLGGDEFVILFASNNHQDIIQFCQKIMSIISLPIIIDQEDIRITASLGLSVFPKDGEDSSSLLKNADIALYLAKKRGRNHFQFYDDDISREVKRKQEIQCQLITSLRKNEFSIVYQPVVNLQTNQIISVEALLRWTNPILGIVSPDEFIPIAEETGLILTISQWVIQTVCQQNRAWQDQGVPPLKIAVNISSIQLKRGNLVKLINDALKNNQLDPACLAIELTESVLMDHSAKTINLLKKLRQQGIEISIDDFGTGYSSFSYLKAFPATKLKIDKSFIHDCTLKENTHSIIKAIVTMGHELNLQVLAEGVETEEQLLLVKQSLCDEMQGYIYSKPLTPEAIFSLMNNNKLAEEK